MSWKKNYDKKIRKMKKYINIIPKKIQFSMFCVDNREVITDLKNKLNSNLALLFNSLENRITRIYENNNEADGDKYIELNEIPKEEEKFEMQKEKYE